MEKKIMIFAPYGQWLVHHQLDAVIGAALMRRGCSVFAVCCDGIFRNCIIGNESSKHETKQFDQPAKPDLFDIFKITTKIVNNAIDPKDINKEILDELPNLDVCRSCFNSATKLFGKLRVPVIKLSSFMDRDDILEADQWASESICGDLDTQTFRGLPVWKWVNAMIYGKVRSSNLDLKQNWIRNFCVDTLYNGALLISAFEKALEVLKPDHQLCYNGGHPYYRVAYELARKRNINVFVHERGQIDDSFFLLNNRVNNVNYEAFPEWNIWRETPLDQASLERVEQLAQERERGANYNFPAFHDWESEASTVRARLRIANPRPIVTLFSTLDWEFSISKALGQVPIFDTQFDWIQATADICEREGWNLVVRHHPLNGGTKAYPCAHHFLHKCFNFNPTLGEHVRIVMPTENISSYDIIWNSDAVAAVFSTTAWEAAIRGVESVYVSQFIFTSMGMNFARSLREYESKLKSIVHNSSTPSAENLKFTYRLINFLYFNVMSHRFKSFGIKNHYQADLRLTAFEDLDVGNDQTMDRVCEHIIHGGPLYEMPTGQDNSRMESEFITARLDEITRRRMTIRKSALDYLHEPEESRVEIVILGDDVRAPFSELAKRCVRRSRYRNLSVTNAAGGPEGFKALLGRIVEQSKSDYICVLPDCALITEAVISSAMAKLMEPSGSHAPGVVWGMYWMPGNEELQTELFTQVHPDPGLAEVLKRVPPLTKPAHWLSLALWRTSAIRKLVNHEYFKRAQGDMALVVLFYEVFFSSASNFLKHTDPSVALLASECRGETLAPQHPVA